MKQSSRSSLKRRVVYYVLTLVCLVLAFFSVRATWNMYATYASVSQYADEAERKYEQLVDRKKELEEDIARLNTSLGKELELRKRYGVGKEGEGVYIFVEE